MKNTFIKKWGYKPLLMAASFYMFTLVFSIFVCSLIFNVVHS